MKKTEFLSLLEGIVKNSEVALINNLEQGEVENLAAEISEKLAPEMVVKKVIVVSGSIDDCPEYNIYTPEEFDPSTLQEAEDDGDGFNKDDLSEKLMFNLIED